MKFDEILICCKIDETLQCMKITSNCIQWFDDYYASTILVWNLGYVPKHHRFVSFSMFPDPNPFYPE